jgi:hypothetical protein
MAMSETGGEPNAWACYNAVTAKGQHPRSATRFVPLSVFESAAKGFDDITYVLVSFA